MGLIYPWTMVRGRGLGHYVREPPGRRTGAWARVPLAAAGCLLSSISLAFLLQVLCSWNGAQREELSHHYGRWDSLKPTQTLLSLYLHGRRWP